MATSTQLATHIHHVYFGGNWTEVNVKDTVSGISFKTATTNIEGFNTILALTYHIHYFLKVQLGVLQKDVLDGKDSESYKHPNMSTEVEWRTLQQAMWKDAEDFTSLVSRLPKSILELPFTDKKYGTYSTNFLGLIEHTHYHLGQIVILKKLIEKNL